MLPYYLKRLRPELLRELYLVQHLSTTQIAARFHVAAPSINYRLRKLGIPLRKRGGPNNPMGGRNRRITHVRGIVTRYGMTTALERKGVR